MNVRPTGWVRSSRLRRFLQDLPGSAHVSVDVVGGAFRLAGQQRSGVASTTGSLSTYTTLAPGDTD